MLYTTANSIFDKGRAQQRELINSDNCFSISHWRLTRSYQLVHPRDWLVRATVGFSCYSRSAELCKLRATITVYQAEGLSSYVAAFDADEGSPSYSIEYTKDVDLLSRIDELKGFFGLKLTDSLADNIADKMQNLTTFAYGDIAEEFRWIYSTCPENGTIQPESQTDFSQDF